MDKNSIIGFILIGAILIGFTTYQSRQFKKQQALQAEADSVALATRMEEAADMASMQIAAEEETKVTEDAVAVYKDTALNAAHAAPESFEVISNDKLEIVFTTRGAQPHSVKVKDFYNYDSTDLYIFKPNGGKYELNIYAGETVKTSEFTFQVAARTDTSIVMRLPFSNGGYIEQKYVLHEGSAMLDNAVSFVDLENVIPRNVSVVDIDYSAIVPRMEKGYKNEAQYSKLNYYFEGDKKPVELGRGRNGSKSVSSKLSWFAFQQQFFSAIVRPRQEFSSGDFNITFYPDKDESNNLMVCEARMRSELPKNDPSDMVLEFDMYFGPNHFQTLKSFDHKYEKIIPLGGSLVGWFTKYAIIPMFNFFHKFIENFGLIILLMTVVIKIVVLPLTYKSYASSAKMQALKPEMEKLNEKYPRQEDALKKQQATMDLYKRAGVSPMGGCLPTLLTFPILWAMFRFFPASIELRQQPFLWCDDLSAYDSIVNFGTRVPLIGDHLSLFALLMAVVMWVYSKMSMSGQAVANDPNAKSMQFMSVWMMPIMMFFICNSLSAALSYYYLISQLISMLEIWLIRRSIDKDAILAKVRAAEGKPLPKSKWQLRLEEAQKMQQAQLREQQKKARR